MAEILPKDEAELAEAVAAAAAERRGLAIRGGGTREAGRAAAEDVLSLAGLTGITLYEPGALTLVVRAGTPLAEVTAALAAEGQRLAFEPWDPRGFSGRNGVPTVGGMAAVNASGPRRIQAGACRDAMIGVRFVDGTGRVIRNGGRVMKNVTGLDLVKLMAGSHGTLGVMTEIAFKLLPCPETVASVVIDGLDIATAARAMTTAMATPYDVTGAGRLPDGPDGAPLTMLRLEGFETSVAHRAQELSAVLRHFGPTRRIEGAGHWPLVRDAGGFGGRLGAVWRISVRPTDGPLLAARLGGAELILDWAGGLVWALVPEDLDLRALMGGIGGHATLLRGAPETFARWGAFHPAPAPVAGLSAGLRTRFDPAGILNPGLMDTRPSRAAVA